MRQQARLLQDERRHRLEITKRRLVTESRERLAGRRIAALGLVAQREKRLLGAVRLAAPGNIEHGFGRQIGRFASTRGVGEGAIVTDIGAELGERDEDLLREGDMTSVPGKADAFRDRGHAAKRIAARKRERLLAVRYSPGLSGPEHLAGFGSAHHGLFAPIGSCSTGPCTRDTGFKKP